MKKVFYLKVYFSLLGKLISSIINLISILFKPFMVYGFYNNITKKYHLRTRISSSSKILNRKNANISDNVWIWHYSIIDATASVKIHEGVQIGAWVGIFTHSSHNAIRMNGNEYFELSSEERVGYCVESIEIGAYTFIGASAIILPGVILGKGCIVSAGSVVNRSFSDYSVISGNPAVLIGNSKKIDKYFLREDVNRKNYYDE